MALAVVNSVPEDDWHNWVNEHPTGNIFHTPHIFRVFARAKGHCPKLWAVVDEARQLLALMLPVEISHFQGLLRPLTTRAVVYGSVLCTPDSRGRQALHVMLQAYRWAAQTKCVYTELRNLSDTAALQAVLCEKGFRYEDHLNYLIDLRPSPDEVFQRFQPRLRSTIRHGLKKNTVTIVDARERKQVGDCYALLAKTYQAARVPLADRSLFEAAFDELHAHGLVWFTLAYVGDKPAACSVELLHGETVYGWYGGLDREYAAHTPNELLMWYILQRAMAAGYKQYDFGGAGKPNIPYSVRDWKAKFGGNLVCFGRNTCVHNPTVFRMGQAGYALYRRFRK
jgi:CelD/BcsL family acetyltransferase involved in cellulose biosynthesis